MRTQVAQWIVVMLLFIFVVYFAHVLVALPRVALSAILVAAGIRLLDIAAMRRLFALDRKAFGLALAVTLGVLILGVLPGVLLGVALSLARVLLEVSRPRDALLRRLPATGAPRSRRRPAGEAPAGILVYRLYAPLVFANARHVAERLRELVDATSPPVRCVCWTCRRRVRRRDRAGDAARGLRRVRDPRIDVRFARANRPLREQLARWLGDHRSGGSASFFGFGAVDDFMAAHRCRARVLKSRRLELRILERQPLHARIAEVTWTRASVPRPSASMITPSPNFACFTLCPMRHDGAAGVACARLSRRPHSHRPMSIARRRNGDSHCTSSGGNSPTKRDAMP